MEHKEAANILIKMLDKHKLGEEEKEAVLAAVGVLSWTHLAQTRLKARKSKQDKSNESFKRS